jgi:hypothetical protein
VRNGKEGSQMIDSKGSKTGKKKEKENEGKKCMNE